MKEELDFQKVEIHINLTKSEIIEKLEEIQHRVDTFEKEKEKNDNMAVAVISIGYSFNPELFPLHKKKAQEKEFKPIPDCEYGNEHYPQYILAKDDEPICMTEYACRLAQGSSTHVIQIDMIEPNAFPNWDVEWNELTLKQREGRSRHSFVKQCDIKNLRTAIQTLYKQPRRTSV